MFGSANEDIVERALAALEDARSSDDRARVEALERLYEELEKELQADQAPAPGR
jgi:hypothetical protein